MHTQNKYLKKKKKKCLVKNVDKKSIKRERNKNNEYLCRGICFRSDLDKREYIVIGSLNML